MLILIIVFINIFFETLDFFENITPLVQFLLKLIFDWNFMTMFIDHGRAVVAEILLLLMFLAILLIAVVDLNLIAVARALDLVGGYPLKYPLGVF